VEAGERRTFVDGQVPAPEIGKGRKRLIWTAVAILLVGAVIGIAKNALDVPRGQDVDLITGFDQKSRLLPPSQYDLAIVLATNYHEYRKNSSWWSLAYYGCLFMSAFLSAMAAFVLKLECFPNRPERKKDLAAFCATIAAVLITLSTVGNFQQKWQANRLAATAMQNLVYEVWAKAAGCESKTDIYARIEEINLLRNQEIVGGNKPEQQKKETQPAGGATPPKNQAGETPKAK
jgi:hypothetical protein